MAEQKPMKHRIGVDQKCIELAKHFLQDTLGATSEDEKDFAESIQFLCEDVCRDIEDRFNGGR